MILPLTGSVTSGKLLAFLRSASSLTERSWSDGLLRFFQALIRVVSEMGQRYVSGFWLLGFSLGFLDTSFSYSALSAPGLEVNGEGKNEVNE